MAFWKRSAGDPEAAARAEYRALRERAEKAALPADRARLLNLAGDAALSVGDEAGAMAVLGDALDLYLRDQQYHPARAVARKLLRVRASTVRVRSTLAWLAVAHDLPADARIALDLYVGSLQEQSQREHAVKHLTTMAEATRDRELRTAIAEHLTSLGARDAADEVLERLRAEEAGDVPLRDDEEIRAVWQDALERLVSPKAPPPR